MFPDISPASEDVSKVLPEGKEIITRNDMFVNGQKISSKIFLTELRRKLIYFIDKSLIYHYYLISYPLIKDVADVIKTVRDLTTPLLHQHKQSFDQNNLRLHFFGLGKTLFFSPKLSFSNPLIFQIMNSFTVSPRTLQTTK